VRQTSRRRFARTGQSAHSPLVPTGAAPQSFKLGPRAYAGDDAVVCPECGVGLDPAKATEERPVPRHSRFGFQVSVMKGRPPCRGCLPEPG
jgi:hypothetical protein